MGGTGVMCGQYPQLVRVVHVLIVAQVVAEHVGQTASEALQDTLGRTGVPLLAASAREDVCVRFAFDDQQNLMTAPPTRSTSSGAMASMAALIVGLLCERVVVTITLPTGGCRCWKPNAPNPTKTHIVRPNFEKSVSFWSCKQSLHQLETNFGGQISANRPHSYRMADE